MRRGQLNDRPQTRTELAESLNNLADTLHDLGRDGDAIAAALEAVQLCTELRLGGHGSTLLVSAWQLADGDDDLADTPSGRQCAASTRSAVTWLHHGCARGKVFRTLMPHRPLMGFTQEDQSDRRYLYAQSRVNSRVSRNG